jgi:hypothetical protein
VALGPKASHRPRRGTGGRRHGRKSPRRTVAVVFALALASSSITWASPARARHIGCGAVVTEDTTLDGDIGPCPGVGIVVAASDITLDLGGHAVVGDARARSAAPIGPGDDGRDRPGIVLRGITGVTVTNGTVTGFDAGVAIVGGGGNTVRHVTARENVNYRIVTGVDARPEDIDPDEGPFCTFGDGITTFRSSNNRIEANVVVGNGPFSGVSLVGNSSDNVVSRNKIDDNDLLNQTPTGDVTICGGLGVPNQPMTRGRRVQDIGVRIEGPGAQRNLVEGNRIRRSGLMGIMVHGNDTRFSPANSHSVIRGNTISETARIGHDLDRQGHGIYLHQPGPAFVHAPHHTTIEGNNSSRNYGGGIFLDSKGTLHSAVVRGNVLNHNGLDGLHVNGPANPDGAPNRFLANRGHGNGARAEEVNAGPDRLANYAGTDGADISDGCAGNIWSRNRFGSVNQPCVAADGTGWVGGPGGSGEAGGGGVGPLGRGRPHGTSP